jgi:hypothetical protein
MANSADILLAQTSSFVGSFQRPPFALVQRPRQLRERNEEMS